MLGTLLAVCVAIWVVSLLISVFEPSFIDIDTYLFFEGLAVVMPFIIVFGGITVAAIFGTIQSFI